MSAAAGSSSGDASAASSESTSSSKNDKADEKRKDDDSWSWQQWIYYLTGGFSGLIFLYYFRKAGYNIHQTELLFIERVRRMHLYPPPRPSNAEVNSALAADAVPADLAQAFAEWFVATDLRQFEGVTRDDIVELMIELGFNEEDKACKNFINDGEGSFEEARRLSGAGLQESLTLLETLAVPAEQREKVSGFARGALIRERLGERETELIKRKSAGVANMMRFSPFFSSVPGFSMPS